jgi:hypothetical protein
MSLPFTPDQFLAAFAAYNPDSFLKCRHGDRGDYPDHNNYDQ